MNSDMPLVWKVLGSIVVYLVISNLFGSSLAGVIAMSPVCYLIDLWIAAPSRREPREVILRWHVEELAIIAGGMVVVVLIHHFFR